MAIVAVFSDIIYTLVHETADIENTVRIDQGRYVSDQALSLVQQIRDTGAEFTLVTGSGQRTYNSLKDIIPHDSAVIEQGGRIYVGGVLDQAWDARMAPVRNDLANLGETLAGMGYSIDENSMGTTYLRLHQDGLERRARMQDFETLVNEGVLYNGTGVFFRLPPGIKAVMHTVDGTPYTPSLDFISESSGKENAITYLLESRGLRWNNVACLGDDFNDRKMLERCGYAVVIGNADESIKALARQKAREGKGHLSQYSSHRGTIDILEKVLECVKHA